MFSRKRSPLSGLQFKDIAATGGLGDYDAPEGLQHIEASTEGRPIGHVQVHPVDQGYTVADIYVHPRYRRRTVASQLLEQAHQATGGRLVPPADRTRAGDRLGQTTGVELPPRQRTIYGHRKARAWYKNSW